MRNFYQTDLADECDIHVVYKQNEPLPILQQQ